MTFICPWEWGLRTLMRRLDYANELLWMMESASVNLFTYAPGQQPFGVLSMVPFFTGRKKCARKDTKFAFDPLGINVSQRLYERDLRQILKLLETDNNEVASIVGEATKWGKEKVRNMMENGVTVNSEDARNSGLITDIEDFMPKEGAEYYSIPGT